MGIVKNPIEKNTDILLQFSNIVIYVNYIEFRVEIDGSANQGKNEYKMADDWEYYFYNEIVVI